MTDQHEQLRLFAADIVLRLERAAPLVAVVAGASRSNPELAQLLATLHSDRLKNLRTLVDALAANGPLRLQGDDAVDTVWALTSPELHQLLIRIRGWSRHRYQDWLASSLAGLLLPKLAYGSQWHRDRGEVVPLVRKVRSPPASRDVPLTPVRRAAR